MTISEFKTVGRLLKEVYSELEKEAINNGISLLSPMYETMRNNARDTVLTNNGFTLDEYKKAKFEISDISPVDTHILAQEAHRKIKALEGIVPTTDQITKIAQDVASQYVTAPQITNQIVRETTVEKPQIIKETTVEKVVEVKAYNEKPMMDKIDALTMRVEGFKIPNSPDLEAFRESLITEWQTSLKKNIDIFGMPDFRKLAMGLRGDIDYLQSQLSTAGGGNTETPTGTVNGSNRC